MSSFQKKLAQSEGLPKNLVTTLAQFYKSYIKAVTENQSDREKAEKILITFLTKMAYYLHHPYHFEPYHQALYRPFDFHRFGVDFIRPLVQLAHSRVVGEVQLKKIEKQLALRENVILFANHQSELDPQVMSLLLEKKHSTLSREMTFVAGHRVTTDPLAIPFSMGCNLFCIHSKRYMEQPPEQKQEKIAHNQLAIRKMASLLSEGGMCIYVAPSGGRDRPNSKGEWRVAPFDPQSIELFYLLSRQSQRPVHFYPLALKTHALLPPPRRIRVKLGEPRLMQSTPLYLAFGSELNMEKLAEGKEALSKEEKRARRALAIFSKVEKLYQHFP